MDALNTFVAGASAGLVGMKNKQIKKDFSLGERFYSEIPTTTLLQGSFGFSPKSGYGNISGTESYAKDMKEYYFEPMEKLKIMLESTSRNRLEGMSEETAPISKDVYDEINKLLDVLKNNQAVVQFRAVFEDLMKEMAEGSRIMEQNVAITKKRFETDKETSGFMTGVPKGLEDYQLGIQKVVS